jgi:type I restriction enzyme S subunit
MKTGWEVVKLGDVLQEYDNSVPAIELTEVNLAGVYSFARGLFKRGAMSPSKTTYKSYNRLVENDFVISTPKAWEGALALVTAEFDGWFLSPVFPTFRVNRERLMPKFLEQYCKRESIWKELQSKARGIGARRESVHSRQFLSLEIPLPPLPEQQRIVARIEELSGEINEARELRRHAVREADMLIASKIQLLFEQGQNIGWESGCIEDYIIEDCYGTSK